MSNQWIYSFLIRKELKEIRAEKDFQAQQSELGLKSKETKAVKMEPSIPAISLEESLEKKSLEGDCRQLDQEILL